MVFERLEDGLFMKVEDITRENTRKEMNNIASKMGMERPGRYSTKKILAEEMLKFIEEQNFEDELANKSEEVKKLLKKVRETNLNLDEFKKGFKEMRAAKDGYNLPKAIELAENLIINGENLLDAKQVIDEIKVNLRKFPEGKIKLGYKEDLKEIVNGFKEGDYSQRVIELKELSDDIKNQYELKIKLEDKFPLARQKLSKLRKIDVDIGLLKKLVNRAVKARKRGAYQEGNEYIDKFLEQCEVVIEISKKIEDCKSNIRELKKLDLDIDHYIQVFQTAKQKADTGDFQYSLELMKDINDEMRQDIQNTRKSLDKKELEEETNVQEEPVVSLEEETVGTESDTEIEKDVYSKEGLRQINRKLDDMENHLDEIKKLLEKLIEQ